MTIYSLTFFQENNSDWSFHVPENYQHDLLAVGPETFFFTGASLCFPFMDWPFHSVNMSY